MTFRNPRHKLALPLALAATILLAINLAAAPDRVVNADLAQIKGPRSTVWRECVGAGRAAEGLRDTWRRQLKTCRDALGFKYLRMHGLLEDELGVYAERDGKPVYNWMYLDDIYDYLLSIGMKPFVELSFMPKALASGKNTVFWWKGNITPPADPEKWTAFITAAVQHWTARYGADEVKTWLFEVWNEPDLSMFWSPADKADDDLRKKTYFALYKSTVSAIKSVNKNYQVGGPASAGSGWVEDFIQFCHENSLPLDFISFHVYNLDGGPSGLDQYGNAVLRLRTNLHYVAEFINEVFPVIARSPNPALPVHMTEWSTSWSPRDPVHDSYFSAPFILEQLRNTERAASMSYWVFTDIFEENGPVPRPFHGGFGLITFQNIKKPAYWAYDFLAKLGPLELQNSDPSSYVCTDAEGGAQVLLWDLTDPRHGAKISDNELFFKPHPTKPKGAVTVNLAGLKPGSYRLFTYEIGYRKNDPYTRYLEQGSPTDLTPKMVADLQALSTGQPAVSNVTVEPAGNNAGKFTITKPLDENSVLLYILKPL